MTSRGSYFPRTQALIQGLILWGALTGHSRVPQSYDTHFFPPLVGQRDLLNPAQRAVPSGLLSPSKSPKAAAVVNPSHLCTATKTREAPAALSARLAPVRMRC